MPMPDGAFHPKAVAEGDRIRDRGSDCQASALGPLIVRLDAILKGNRNLADEYDFVRRVDDCDLFARSYLTLGCDEGVSVVIGVRDGRRVVLAIVAYVDSVLEALTGHAQQEAMTRSLQRLQDI